MTYTAPSSKNFLKYSRGTDSSIIQGQLSDIEDELTAQAALITAGSGSSLLSTRFVVGNSSNVGAAVAMSGDATLANTGAVTVSSSIKNKHAFLTHGMGTRTALVTSGVDLASGSNAVYYGVFFAPVAITAVTLEILVNEVYAKNAATDSIVILKDNAVSPATIFINTMTAGGVVAGSKISVTPETGAAVIAAGTRLDLYITATGAGGTGYVDVILRYTVN